jgi:diacylglycerol kinase
MSVEGINTAVEKIADFIHLICEKIGFIKDTFGAVFLLSLQ